MSHVNESNQVSLEFIYICLSFQADFKKIDFVSANLISEG